MNAATEAIVSIATAIVGVAILAVLVSKNSQSPAVITAAGNAFSGALSVATGPVMGGNSGYPVSTFTHGVSGLGPNAVF
jgi:hypothetical protein